MVIVSNISARLLAIPARLSQVQPKSARKPLSPRAQQRSHHPTSLVSSAEISSNRVFDAYSVLHVTNFTKAETKYMWILDVQNNPVRSSSTSVIRRLSDPVDARGLRISAVNSA